MNLTKDELIDSLNIDAHRFEWELEDELGIKFRDETKKSSMEIVQYPICFEDLRTSTLPKYELKSRLHEFKYHIPRVVGIGLHKVAFCAKPDPDDELIIILEATCWKE
jgi:hypothetical protein